MRSVTKDLSGAWAAAPPHGYPVRQERVDYVSDNPSARAALKIHSPEVLSRVNA
jgi:hypothetical protein